MTINAAGFDFSKFVPGFEFLKQMTQPRGLAPSPAQWVAPTVDPEEVDRRIQELRTVQFWLEQNTTALKATIQALEVQKMTLTTLRSMNVGLNDMAQTLQQGVADTMTGVTEAMQSAASATEAHTGTQPAASAEPAATPDAESAFNTAFAQAGQWWGGMLQTFQQIAQQAQEEVLKQQADFVKAQEDALAQQAAAAENTRTEDAAAADTPAAEPAAPAPAPRTRKSAASGTAKAAAPKAAAGAKAAPRKPAAPRRKPAA